MPIKSMTGFGLAEMTTPSGLYRVEIRAVNNRYSEIQIRLPRFAANLEQRVKKRDFVVGVTRFDHCSDLL
ncbi:MAG TPA: YicC/YloC family endoribonuclease [Chitinispirillaceae bacterium]|nr:YicC/YloC family endoribonuclease [Chitinispirillaceae bacterium]